VETKRKPKGRRPAAALPVYKGRFGEAQAERLLWRAGFGPKPGQARALARKGLEGAVLWLTRPGTSQLVGPAPVDDTGIPIAPRDAFGHDHLWFLDRMTRTTTPLVERMTLIWHDWFATSNSGVGQQGLLLDQNELFRRHALGSFRQLVLDVTKDPAMLLWLSGNRNTKKSPNENYARELMELFTLGEGRGYTEADVREQARALTGWRNRFTRGVGPHDFHYDPSLHDDGEKRIFGRRGRFGWEDACRLCLEHPAHAAFVVTKLWSYFVPTPPAPATRRALEQRYRAAYQVRPVVAAILKHPDLYDGPRMVKPPVVYAAGLLRAIGGRVDGRNWASFGSLGGQRLFYPPDVAGWDESRWLDTATYRGRWLTATRALRPFALDPRAGAVSPMKAKPLVDRAISFWANPALSDPTRKALLRFAERSLKGAKPADAVGIENALRQLIAVTPEMQTS
jgi:uncharacterized protein (DUF1800 family)